jgi:Single-strand binding protein family
VWGRTPGGAKASWRSPLRRLCAEGEFPLWPPSTQTNNADGDDPNLGDGDTSYLRVNVWRGQAEHLATPLSKGDRVMVTGRLRQLR